MARCPSTVESQRLSLLCEASLTHCPLVQEPWDSSLCSGPIAQLYTWSGQASDMQHQVQPSEACIPSSWCPNLGYKLTLHSSASLKCCQKLIYDSLCQMLDDVGLPIVNFPPGCCERCNPMKMQSVISWWYNEHQIIKHTWTTYCKFPSSLVLFSLTVLKNFRCCICYPWNGTSMVYIYT